MVGMGMGALWHKNYFTSHRGKLKHLKHSQVALFGRFLLNIFETKQQIIANEWLKFSANWKNPEDCLIIPIKEKCLLQKFLFQVEFGIRAKDNNIYPFTLSLMSLKKVTPSMMTVVEFHSKASEI